MVTRMDFLRNKQHYGLLSNSGRFLMTNMELQIVASWFVLRLNYFSKTVIFDYDTNLLRVH